MSERYIPEHRRNFKQKGAFKPEELRRRREEQQVEIRKAKREENLAKRRGIQTSSGQIGVGGATTDSDDEGGNIESEVSLIIARMLCISFNGLSEDIELPPPCITG